MPGRALLGRRVVTTRDAPGRLDSALARMGADVVHVPLISVEPPHDDGAELVDKVALMDGDDWLIVTSRHGARAVGASLSAHAKLRLAAVGATTAAVLADLSGREVDVVPTRQTATALVEAMARHGGRALIAQADRADGTLADGLRRVGFDVDVVTAYRTVLRPASAREAAAALGSDAVAFASGSAAQGWASTIGSQTPGVVAAIGPSTADVARRAGLQVTHVATDHDVTGLARVIATALTNSS